MLPLPAFAAWRFVDAVDGFEVLYAGPGELRGHTSAVEDGQPYAVTYRILFDDQWRTREAHVSNDTLTGQRHTVITSDGAGHWRIDGEPRPDLDGLVDVDLEASACTNTFPVHRLDLPTGTTVTASAVYVQALDLAVRRLDQTYRRLDDTRFGYTSEDDFSAELAYDTSGLILDYPGIAARAA